MSNDKQNCVTIYIDARYAAASSRDAISSRNMQQFNKQCKQSSAYWIVFPKR